MGWKLGYITSLDGARVKDAGLPSVVEEVDDEPARVEKLSEYDGGWALSKGVGKVGSAVDSGWYPKLVSGGCDTFSKGAGNSRLSPSVVPTRRRPLVFSGVKIMNELECGEFSGENNLFLCLFDHFQMLCRSCVQLRASMFINTASHSLLRLYEISSSSGHLNDLVAVTLCNNTSYFDFYHAST